MSWTLPASKTVPGIEVLQVQTSASGRRGAASSSVRAAAAGADDREMREIGLKAVPLAQVLVERAELVHVDLALGAAPPADHVLVVRVLGQVVQRDAVIKVGVRHQPEVLEQLKRAVHRRDVDLRKLGGDPGMDRLGGRRGPLPARSLRE